MADDSDQIVEEIVLKLKSNWDQELRNTVRQLNKFKDQVADVSKAAANSYGNFQKQFVSEFGSMSKNTIGEMRVLIGATRRELGELQRVNDNFLKSQEEAATKMERLSKAARTRAATKVQGIYSEAEEQKSWMRKKAKLQGKLPNLGAEAAIDTGVKSKLDEIEKSYIETARKIKANAIDPLYLESAKVHSKISEVISSTAQKSLRSVTATTNDLIKQYDKVKNLITFGGEEGKITQQAQFLANLRKQFQSAGGTLRMQQARMDEIESMRKVAENMLSRARKEDVQAIANYIKIIEKEQMAVKSAMEGTTKQIMLQKDLIKTATTDAIANGARIQQSLKAAISPLSRKGGDIDIAAKGVFKNLSEMVVASTKGDAGGFIKAQDNVRMYIGELDKAEAKLKQLKTTLQAVSGTGLIDDNIIKSTNQKIADSLNLIKQQRNEIASTVKTFKELNMQKMMQKTDTSAFDRSIENIYKLKTEYMSLGKINEQNYLIAYGQLQKIEKAHETYVQHRATLERQLLENEKSIASIRSAMNITNDQAMKNSYAKAIDAMIAKSQELNRSIQKASPVANIDSYKADRVKIAAQAQKVADEIQKSIKPEGWLDAGIEKLRNDLIKLQETAKKVGKFNPFKDYKQEVSDLYSSLKAGSKSFVTEIQNIQRQIVELKRIQKSGLIDSESIGKTITQLQAMQKHFRYANQEFSRINNQASKAFQTAMETSSKGFFKHGMEMIRNFRWQYAAVYYILQNIIGRIATFVKTTMDEIASFQKDAMSLAAVISMRMFGDIQQNFDTAYTYSKGLMDKLNLVATETVLTLEDLTMLTKTFVQAGVIPDTTEDVRKIAAIGVAVKAVTEGMANAGTQMRQELNAVILGRQRTSDQLAMMFKFMGINLKKVIQDAKDAGVSILDALSDALEPFQAMNKAMEKNWLQVSNRAEEVWKIIKRIGAEDFTRGMTEKLSEFLDKIIDAKGQLTFLGREYAARFGAVMSTLGYSIVSILNTLVNIGGVVSKIGEQIFGTNERFKEMSFTLRTILTLSHGILRFFIAIENVTSFIVSSLDVIFAFADKYDQAASDATDIMHGFTSEVGDADGRAKALADAIKRWKENSQAAEDRVKSIKGIFDGIVDKLEEASSKTTVLGEIFKLPHDSIALLDRWVKQQDDMKRARLAGLSGPAKFKEEYELDVKGLGSAKEQMEENIAAYEKYFAGIETGSITFSAKQYKRYKSEYETLKEILGDENKLRQYYLDKMNKQTQDWYDKERVRIAGLKKEWERFIIDTSEAPISEWGKLDKWIADTQENMKLMLEKNRKDWEKLGAFEFKKVEGEKAIKIGIDNRSKKIMEDYIKNVEDIMEKVRGFEFKTPFMEIDSETKKIQNDVDELFKKFDRGYSDHSDNIDYMREQWGKVIVNMTTAKKRLAEINNIQQLFNANIDLASRQMNYWKDNYDPAIRRQAELNSALIEYVKNIGDLKVKYEENEVKLVAATKAGTESEIKYFEAMRENYVAQLEIMKLETEKLIWKDLNPLWAEMVEMSKSWGDSMTDAIADVVDGTKDMETAFEDLAKSIKRDVLRATIKQMVTEPIMGFLGSGEPGSPTILQRLMGKGGPEPANAMAKTMAAVKAENDKLMNAFLKGATVIPVRIVDPNNPVTEAVQSASEQAKEEAKNTTDAVEETKRAIDEGFVTTSNNLLDLISAVAAGNYAQAAKSGGGLLGGFGDIFKGIPVIGDLFGGGGGGNLVGQADRAAKVGGFEGSVGSSGGFFSGIKDWFGGLFTGSGGAGAGKLGMIAGMAEGGEITEPIMGRGMQSGKMYAFGEKTPYGQNEIVAPIDKLAKAASENGGTFFNVNMPVKIQAIDTQTGAEFLIKNSPILEGNMIKMLRNNRKLREAMRSR